MDKYQETFNTWNKIALLYEEHFMDLDLYNDSYNLFCDALLNTSTSILEIGCGPGNITKHIRKKNPKMNITAIDIAPNMIQLAKQHNPDVEFKVMDCRDIGHINSQFDGIIAGFVIPYLSKTDCNQFIQNCSSLLNNKGIVYLSFVAGNYEKSTYLSGSTGDRMYFYYHKLNTVLQSLKTNTLVLKHLIEKEYTKSDNSKEIHTILIAQKHSNNRHI